jgi:hypothetical protein
MQLGAVRLALKLLLVALMTSTAEIVGYDKNPQSIIDLRVLIWPY